MDKVRATTGFFDDPDTVSNLKCDVYCHEEFFEGAGVVAHCHGQQSGKIEGSYFGFAWPVLIILAVFSEGPKGRFLLPSEGTVAGEVIVLVTRTKIVVFDPLQECSWGTQLVVQLHEALFRGTIFVVGCLGICVHNFSAPV